MANIRDHWIQPAICSYCEKEFPIRYDNRMERLRKEGKLFCNDQCRKKYKRGVNER